MARASMAEGRRFTEPVYTRGHPIDGGEAHMKETIPHSMNALRLHAPGGVSGLVYERIDTPRPKPGEVLVRVHAAAITRDELEWPADRLPAIPSYELAGVVVEVAHEAELVGVGDAVYALTAFDH